MLAFVSCRPYNTSVCMEQVSGRQSISLSTIKDGATFDLGDFWLCSPGTWYSGAKSVGDV